METEIILCSLKPDEFKSIIREAVYEIIDEAFIRAKIELNREEGDKLITLNEVAKILGKSKVTIHKWKKEGLIPSYRIGTKIFFKKNEVIGSLKKIKTL